MNCMNYVWLIPYYISWHYTVAILGLFQTWKNFIWFFFNYFSISVLLRTLFQPFERIEDRYKKGMQPREIFESIIFNLISRVVGFVMRIVVIVFGIFVIMISVLAGIVIFVLWILMPFVLGFILINGLRLLIVKPL